MITHIKGTGLTGRQRLRVEKTWFKKPFLVLQVEENTETMMVYGSGVDIDTGIRWRDAVVEDGKILFIEISKRLSPDDTYQIIFDLLNSPHGVMTVPPEFLEEDHH